MSQQELKRNFTESLALRWKTKIDTSTTVLKKTLHFFQTMDANASA